MKKFKYILGIQNFANMDSGASIIKFSTDGKFLDYVAISEERLIRKKFPYTFPVFSIDYCLKYFGLENLKQIDLIVTDWIRLKRWEFSGPTYNVLEFDYLKQILKFDKSKIRIIDHHLAHAASTYYSSGFDKSAILIVDGNGSDLETTTYYKANNFNINFMENYKYHGIGACYGTVTMGILNLGLGGEGKTMGLAPYGKKHHKKNNFRIKYKLKGIENDFSEFMRRMPYSDVLNQIDPKYRINPFKQKVKKCDEPNKVTNKYYSSVAYEIQNVTEKVLIHLANDLYKKTNNENICIAGGVGLNSVSNKKILDKTNFKNIFIFPACSDSGIPFGLAIWGYYYLKELGSFKRKKLYFPNAYTGNEYSNQYIINCLNKYKIKYEKVELKKVAEKISNGNIVGWFQGRSEYGPRSLGNRSILADSRRKKMKDILNKRVKHRESFRPFAPSILEEYSSKYFDLKCSSPYMLLIAKVKKPKLLPAITHVDGTARVQTVSKKSNKKFYSLIEKFNEITGVPCILNTSFNDAGDPIVESPEDALETFFKCDMDYLYIDKYLISKKQVQNSKKLYKKIYTDIRNKINKTKNLLIKKHFNNFTVKKCNEFIKKNNNKAVTYLIEKCKNNFERKINEWIKKNKRILIVGTEDHTQVLFENFKSISKLNIVGFVSYSNKFDYDKNIRINIKKVKLEKNIIKKYDEILISSYEYNFEILAYLLKLKLRYFSIYDNTSRDFAHIFKNKLLFKLKNKKL
jgi:carbamoyltransferase